MPKRDIPRINYKSLNSTGEIVPVDNALSETITNMTLDDDPAVPSTLQIDIMVIIAEIVDLIDESPPSCEDTALRLEGFRSELRRKGITLNTSDPGSKIQEEISKTLDMVKEYIRTTKDIQSKTKLRQDQMKHEEHIRKQQSTNFIIDHIYREPGELDEQFKKQPEDATDDKLIKLRSDLPSLSRKFEKIAENYTSILKSPIFNAEHTPAINDIGKKFEKLSGYKKKYVKMLHDEISSREVDKDRQFNKSNLNIKLDKFTGYDSKIDYYTFRSSFEKMHLQSTPKRLLPDLLKNNFLADPALTLVKSLNDIDLIWQRLSDAYGNPKIMLSKRLQQLTKMDGIGKPNNPEKMINNVSRLVNMLNDVKRLARKHHIEEHLYYGDGLTKVYQLIGDSRTTKFLTSICDDDLQQREVWDKLIPFLDKEKKVHQQAPEANRLGTSTKSQTN